MSKAEPRLISGTRLSLEYRLPLEVHSAAGGDIACDGGSCRRFCCRAPVGSEAPWCSGCARASGLRDSKWIPCARFDACQNIDEIASVQAWGRRAESPSFRRSVPGAARRGNHRPTRLVSAPNARIDPRVPRGRAGARSAHASRSNMRARALARRDAATCFGRFHSLPSRCRCGRGCRGRAPRSTLAGASRRSELRISVDRERS